MLTSRLMCVSELDAPAGWMSSRACSAIASVRSMPRRRLAASAIAPNALTPPAARRDTRSQTGCGRGASALRKKFFLPRVDALVRPRFCGTPASFRWC